MSHEQINPRTPEELTAWLQAMMDICTEVYEGTTSIDEESQIGDTLTKFAYQLLNLVANNDPDAVVPAIVREELENVIALYENDTSRRGRKATRTARLLQVLRGRENTLISIDDLNPQFEGTADPYNTIKSTISMTNQRLNEINSQFVIEHVTAWRVRRRRGHGS